MNIQTRLGKNWTPRQRVNFLEELFLTSSVAELCQVLRRHLEKRCPGRLTLLIRTTAGRLTAFEFLHGQYVQRRLAPEDPFLVENGMWLAETLKRPLGQYKTIQIPLKASGEDVWILLENSTEASFQLIKSVEDLIHASLVTLLIKHRLEDASDEWASTFEFMSDPVMIVDQERRIQKSNRIEHQLGGFCYEAFGQSEACDQCPMGSDNKIEILTGRGRFEVLSQVLKLAGHQKMFVHHYKDTTRDRHLYSQLVQSQKMAAVGLLAGNIAHELSNPLAGIKSLVESVLPDLPKESSHTSDFQEVREAAIRSQKIIQNLLSFAFAGQQEQAEVFEPVAIIQRTLPLLKVQLHGHQIQLEGRELPIKALGHVSAFQQVVFNLIHNSCQAMKGTGQIWVEFSAEGDRVHVDITDSGGGIGPDIAKRMFEAFFTTKTVDEGTGLGLSVARQLMVEMGGDLQFLGNSAEGAIFRISLRKDLGA